MAWYWLSFADPQKPRGEQFLGVVILEVTERDPVPAFGLSLIEMARRPKKDWEFFAAVGKARDLGINPGARSEATS